MRFPRICGVANTRAQHSGLIHPLQIAFTLTRHVVDTYFQPPTATWVPEHRMWPGAAMLGAKPLAAAASGLPSFTPLRPLSRREPANILGRRSSLDVRLLSSALATGRRSVVLEENEDAPAAATTAGAPSDEPWSLNSSTLYHAIIEGHEAKSGGQEQQVWQTWTPDHFQTWMPRHRWGGHRRNAHRVCESCARGGFGYWYGVRYIRGVGTPPRQLELTASRRHHPNKPQRCAAHCGAVGDELWRGAAGQPETPTKLPHSWTVAYNPCKKHV